MNQKQLYLREFANGRVLLVEEHEKGCHCSYCFVGPLPWSHMTPWMRDCKPMRWGLNLPEDRSRHSWRVFRIGRFFIRWTPRSYSLWHTMLRLFVWHIGLFCQKWLRKIGPAEDGMEVLIIKREKLFAECDRLGV